MRSNVTFNSHGLKLAGHLYLPADFKDGERRAAILVCHPFGGVKEQTAGLYVERLAASGFVTLAFDAAYQGESEGEPRFLEDPFARAEDIKSAVNYLSNLAQVDPLRIGALGICAAGGYVPYTAQTERRIKAVAAVSGTDMGMLFREGLGGGGSAAALRELLDEVGLQRSREARGDPARLDPVVPHTPAEVADGTPTLYREGSDYYRTARGQHPNSPNKYLFTSIDRIAAYASYERVDLISPHPLLLIAGTEADTRYFSELAYAKAHEPKELFLVDGASHVDLYDKPQYVGPAVDKLTAFFTRYL
ncbi:alpha/beta hydrolase [Janthinobacterium lividum]|nr:alpha/beta hydrolase [Janthinobacterium lividum]